MTQEDVRRLMEELGGEATTGELSQLAKERFPERTLDTYVGSLLRRLRTKGFVTTEDEITWELTKKGWENSIEGIAIDEVDDEVVESELNELQFEISNIVSTLDVNRQFDLSALSQALEDAKYHPESSPFLVFQPLASATLLVPTNGLISIVGAKSPEETVEATELFFENLDNLSVDTRGSISEIIVQNVVATGNLGTELDLNPLALAIGLEHCEYEPEQFPGLIYRDEYGSTILVFRSGSCVITGAKSYGTIKRSILDFSDKLTALGIEM